MKKRIYLPIEIIIRELDSKLLLGISLLINSNNEWEVIIGNVKKMGSYINRKNKTPFIWLDKGVEINPLKLKKILYNNGRAILLDEEGGVYTRKHKKFPRGLKVNSALQFYEKIFFWGQETYNNWQKLHKNLKASQLVISGNPRFDLSKKDFINYFKNLNPCVPNYKYILISTAFGNGNPHIPIDKNYSVYWNKINAGTVNSIDFEITDYQKRLFEPFLRGIERLVKDFPNEKFILRPHPFENMRSYDKYFKDLKNIDIIYSGPIQDWLPNAKFIIHSGCTTAIEAFFHKLNAICYAPIEGEDNEQFTTFEISDVAEDYEALYNSFKEKLNENYIDYNLEKKTNFIKYYIHNYGAKNSYEEIIKIIDQITFKYIDIDLDFKEKIKTLIPDDFYNFLSKSKTFLFKSHQQKKFRKSMKVLDYKKFPDLSLKDINIRVTKLLKLLNYDNHIDIIETKPNIFMLKKKN